MNVQYLQIVFVIFAFLYFALTALLELRELRLIKKFATFLPEELEALTNLESHQKASTYSIVKIQYSLCMLIFNMMLWMLLFPFGYFNQIALMLYDVNATPMYNDLVLIASISLLQYIVHLPWQYYYTFVIQEKFGFNRSTIKTFITDQFKMLILGALLGGGLIFALLKILYTFEASWWWMGFLVFMSFQFFVSWAYPTILAPIFNKFSPLDDQELAQGIEKLMNEANKKISGIFVMDASKRTAQGNAYFGGLGNTKRVVFYDTLLKQMNHEQILAILAHELGHMKHGHIKKGLILSTIISFVTFFVLGFLYENEQFYQMHFLTQKSAGAFFILISSVGGYYTFFMSPIMNIWSRKNEYEADRYAKQATSASAMKSALIKLYQDNSSCFLHDKIYSTFYFSHPSALDRLGALDKNS